MQVPPENWLAAFPPVVKAGRVVLRPLTLAGAIRLGAAGLDCGKAVPREKLFEAAFVLSGETDYRRFLRRTKCGLRALSAAVETVLNDAFATALGPAARKNATKHLTPHGLGWPLELAEFLCAEYGWSWQEALETPVVTVYALAAAARQRTGGKHGGFDYVERQYNEDVKSGRVKPVRIDNGKEEAV